MSSFPSTRFELETRFSKRGRQYQPRGDTRRREPQRTPILPVELNRILVQRVEYNHQPCLDSGQRTFRSGGQIHHRLTTDYFGTRQSRHMWFVDPLGEGLRLKLPEQRPPAIGPPCMAG